MDKLKYIFFFGVFFCLYSFAQENRSYEYLNMKSSPFIVDESYLSKHDIVYLSPTQLEAEGFPMGNGDLGGIIWNNDNGIEIQINKNDLWTNISKEEGNTSILKHAVRLKIDFGIPVFSWIHLKKFEGRLSLKNGEVTYKSESAFSKTNITTWLTQEKNVWVVECDNVLKDDESINGNISTISMERVGSRTFSRWYAGDFSKDVSTGLGMTNTRFDNDDIVVEEKGDGLNFVVVCRIIKGPDSKEIISKHRVDFKTRKQNFILLLTVVTDKESSEPLRTARKLLDTAENNGIEQLKKEKNSWYKNFWSNSFVKIGDDYIENIYYLRRYLMAAASQGEFPVTFNGGLWRWNRDVMNWVTPHHWNTQQQYWGLCAQNDCQLMLPYLNTYYKMIPYGISLAKEKGACNDALLFTEAHCFDGFQVTKDRDDMKNNFTPAAQISTLFWDYYDFTGDKIFLRDKAYPFMRKVLNFYMDKLEWDKEKNMYYLYSSVYESAEIEYVKNAITDRVCIEQLFKNCIKAASILKVDEDKISQWEYVLEHLWPISYQKYETCGETISPAEEYYTDKRYTPWIWSNGGIVAFPANLIGIDDINTRMGKAVINLVNYKSDANAHYPIPEVAARMGLGDKALEYIENGINIHQIYPQGLMHNVTGYPDDIYDLNSQHDLLNHTYVIRSKDFFQCGMEPISNYSTAVNEMMLQSNEGKIRIFPAVPSKWDNMELAFTLLARGAFIVSSIRYKNSIVKQIGIKSLQGNMCNVQSPWNDYDGIVIIDLDLNNKVKYLVDGKGVISFPTKKNREYIILNTNLKDGNEKIIEKSVRNNKVKHLGKRTLGKYSGWNDEYISTSNK